MGLHGCSNTGELNDAKFSEPLPWIGLYIAGASLVCSLAMAIDTFYGFRQRKPWFPCKFFSLNATSLTLLSIATKLPLDLNTSMPRRQDQLTKLSGTILICTAMGNFMTSLGTMEDSEMLSNIVALAILVITMVVNIGIQMGTGVIYAFLPEHAVIMFFIIVLLMIFAFSGLTIPTAKQLLEQQYDKKHELASDEGADNTEVLRVDKLKEAVNKYWMMAHTCSPQYVLGRSATCTASGAFCLLSALILLEALVRSFILSSLDFCSGESDYRWSSNFILISQVIAVGVGTIAPAIRWFNAISFRSMKSGEGRFRDVIKVEGYWVQRLVEWKESPLPFRISSRRCRKIAHVSKNQILDACIGIQTAVVLICKFVCLASILPMSWLIRLFSCCRKQHWRNSESNKSESQSLQDFVLHLEGENDLVHLIMKSGRKDTVQWIERGRKNEPTHLIELLKKPPSSGDFNGVAEFDSDQVPPIGEKPPNCWALPLVTLTSIAIALPYIDKNIIRSLRHAVDEGLRYVRLIEENLDANGLSRMREAADIVWLGIDIYDQWLDKDLHKLVTEEKQAEKIIRKLADLGKESIETFTDGSVRETGHREWPAKLLAANSMYRIGETILQDYKDKLGTVDKLFKWLQTTIADILGACLTNLPRVISMECFCSSIEVREERVRDAAYLLGEARSILAILTEHEFPDLDRNKMANIDEWRLSKQGKP
ncbi:uncharacterized protein LOC131249500 [Magnolia sinica]|uniref:uncharacterized protein LOC131249500 n=1 Tax=Magnolia sinica TaxID=86752 RepID=UPI00265AD744|nr:uncharacterized protein LOC131249500 [Magnolia sinica]